MAKIPDKPQEIFKEITDDLRGVYGNGLQSVILYGSGARGDYVPGKSDINLLVVLDERSIDDLERAIPLIGRWRKRSVAVPLFMTKTFICSSVDVYPVEFFNMKRHYQLVYGEDVFKDLVFEKPALRLQCEREMKGKLMLLRTGFLETAGSAEDLRRLIAASCTAYLSVFGALLLLKELDVPHGRQEIVTAAAGAYGFDESPFLRCLNLKTGKESPSLPDLKTLFRSYVAEIEKLIKAVDEQTE